MAFGRLQSKKAAPPMGEINMTPLIDVMLVLLVIFMVAAPLLGPSLRLDLPQAEGGSPTDAPALLDVALDARGRLLLDGQPLDDAALRARLAQAAGRQPPPEVQLQADRAVPYGRVAELIGWLQAAGLTRIGFVTQAPSAAPAASRP